MTAELTDRHIRTDISMQAVAHEKQIHLLFSEEDAQAHTLRPAFTSNFLMGAGDALAFSTLLADLAFEADTGLKAAGPALKAEMVERHRAKLTDRMEVMLNSMREKRTIGNRALAKQFAEICLKEVLA